MAAFKKSDLARLEFDKMDEWSEELDPINDSLETVTVKVYGLEDYCCRFLNIDMADFEDGEIHTYIKVDPFAEVAVSIYYYASLSSSDTWDDRDLEIHFTNPIEAKEIFNALINNEDMGRVFQDYLAVATNQGMLSMEVYCSSMPGVYSNGEIESDNLTEIEVPKAIVRKYFNEKILESFRGDDPSISSTGLFTEWLDEYTADATDGLWGFAIECGYTVKRFPNCTFFRDAIKESEFQPGVYGIGFCREEDGKVIDDRTEFEATEDVSELWFLFKDFCEENDYPWSYNIRYIERVGDIGA